MENIEQHNDQIIIRGSLEGFKFSKKTIQEQLIDRFSSRECSQCNSTATIIDKRGVYSCILHFLDDGELIIEKIEKISKLIGDNIEKIIETLWVANIHNYLNPNSVENIGLITAILEDIRNNHKVLIDLIGSITSIRDFDTLANRIAHINQDWDRILVLKHPSMAEEINTMKTHIINNYENIADKKAYQFIFNDVEKFEACKEGSNFKKDIKKVFHKLKKTGIKTMNEIKNKAGIYSEKIINTVGIIQEKIIAKFEGKGEILYKKMERAQPIFDFLDHHKELIKRIVLPILTVLTILSMFNCARHHLFSNCNYVDPIHQAQIDKLMIEIDTLKSQKDYYMNKAFKCEANTDKNFKKLQHLKTDLDWIDSHRTLLRCVKDDEFKEAKSSLNQVISSFYSE